MYFILPHEAIFAKITPAVLLPHEAK